jgi:hypothetical protein
VNNCTGQFLRTKNYFIGYLISKKIRTLGQNYLREEKGFDEYLANISNVDRTYSISGHRKVQKKMLSIQIKKKNVIALDTCYRIFFGDVISKCLNEE